VRIVLLAMTFAPPLSANLAAATPHVGAAPRAYYCEYPKSVTVAKRTVTTPEICIPSP
jgi:hypothetical protein